MILSAGAANEGKKRFPVMKDSPGIGDCRFMRFVGECPQMFSEALGKCRAISQGVRNTRSSRSDLCCILARC